MSASFTNFLVCSDGRLLVCLTVGISFVLLQHTYLRSIYVAHVWAYRERRCITITVILGASDWRLRSLIELGISFLVEDDGLVA
jgi:hypothetical protein